MHSQTDGWSRSRQDKVCVYLLSRSSLEFLCKMVEEKVEEKREMPNKKQLLKKSKFEDAVSCICLWPQVLEACIEWTYQAQKAQHMQWTSAAAKGVMVTRWKDICIYRRPSIKDQIRHHCKKTANDDSNVVGLSIASRHFLLVILIEMEKIAHLMLYRAVLPVK